MRKSSNYLWIYQEWKSSDLKIDVDDNNVLHISGSRKETFSANGQVSRKKRRVSYSMMLDGDVDVKEMKANLSDDVLLVSAPKVANIDCNFKWGR